MLLEFFFSYITQHWKGEREEQMKGGVYFILFYVMWVGFLFYFIFILIVTVGNFFLLESCG